MKNQVAWITRWATWSWSNCDKLRRLCIEHVSLQFLAPTWWRYDGFEALMTPYYRATFQSRWRRHWHNNGNKTMQDAVDTKRGAKKRGDHPSMLGWWQNDEIFRASQVAIGWTETYVKYFDYLATVDTKHDAPHRQRNRYEIMIFMMSYGPNPWSKTIVEKRRLQASTSALMCLQEEQGKSMPHIPMHMTTR